MPREFAVDVNPPATTGTWVERSSFVPAGINIADRSRGRIAPQMRFRRKYLDSSFEIVVVTDEPATVTVRRLRR